MLSFNYSTNKPLISSLPTQTLFKFKNSHVKISQIPIQPRFITTKASFYGAATFRSAPDKKTLYDLLDISENGTLSDIKHAYKKMALKYHPDVSPPDRVEVSTPWGLFGYKKPMRPYLTRKQDSNMIVVWPKGWLLRAKERPGLTRDPMIRRVGRRRGRVKFRSSSGGVWWILIEWIEQGGCCGQPGSERKGAIHVLMGRIRLNKLLFFTLCLYG